MYYIYYNIPPPVTAVQHRYIYYVIRVYNIITRSFYDLHCYKYIILYYYDQTSLQRVTQNDDI